MTDGGSGSGDVRRDQGRDEGQARSPATFGTGPSGDVAPPDVREQLPRRDRNAMPGTIVTGVRPRQRLSRGLRRNLPPLSACVAPSVSLSTFDSAAWNRVCVMS